MFAIVYYISRFHVHRIIMGSHFFGTQLFVSICCFLSHFKVLCLMLLEDIFFVLYSLKPKLYYFVIVVMLISQVNMYEE